MIEDGKKHVLILYNCKLDMTGEVSFQAANAKSAANLKVKGRLQKKLDIKHSILECSRNQISPPPHAKPPLKE